MEALLTAAIGPGQVIPGAEVAGLLSATGLPDMPALMRALLPAAQALARPPISHFRVGAVGRAAGSGDLILGANVEFPGAAVAETIHAEQFLFSRAHALGARLETIMVSARPCGHCRQFMSEFAGADRLTILDPDAGALSLDALLPFRFGPTDLGMPGADPAARQNLTLADEASHDPALLAALLAAGACAHTPYSGAPSAIALRLATGEIVTGSTIENAAYNPGLPPLQAALVTLVALGRNYSEITAALLGRMPGAAFDFTASSAKLLDIIAPDASLETLSWRPAQSS
ncbi:cytidine deaminase [Acidisoma sp. 7E03]